MSPADGATYVPEMPDYRGGGQRLTDADVAEGNGRGREPGLRGWAAVVLLIVIAGIGGLIDQVSGSQVRGVFGYALVLASLVAILLVKRGQMFAVVVAPPLVYVAASGAKLYLAGGLHNRKVLIDYASSWLVYGFPAIAGATAVVLVIAGIRLITGR